MNSLSKPLHGCSSSSYKYDVFLSFRGRDTRNSLIDHLYNALMDAGINTFLDDEEIVTGKPLKPEIESAIKSSRVFIIVFSKNYAFSAWCLDELLLIHEQQRDAKQFVLPIFYDVMPTVVRKKLKSFGKAMESHKQRMEKETDAEKRSELAKKIELWKSALTQVANIKGKVAKNRKETDLIKEVITDINSFGVPSPNTLPVLIGMDDHIQYISSWLTDESCNTACILTVVGLGGSGKTLLARYVFLKHSGMFSERSFIEDVNRTCNPHSNGMLSLLNQLLRDVSKKNLLEADNVIEGTSKIENILVRKRAFIVLDDIASPDQLDALLGNKGLHPETKIIVTTNKAYLTEKCQLNYQLDGPPIRMKEILLKDLCESKSLELFCYYAFRSHKPNEGYKEFSEKIVKYSDGYACPLVELGKYLHKQNQEYWEDCISGLKKELHSAIKSRLMMSFNSLPFDNDRNILKYIAYFFVGENKDLTETVLKACDMETGSGIQNLIDKCLLSIGPNNKLVMKPCIQQMGRDLVHKEYSDPLKRSLLCHEESLDVFQKEKVMRNTVGLALDMNLLGKDKSFELKTEKLSKMCNLMLLQLNNVQFSGSFENFPKELRWLCMHGFPLKSIPLDLPMNKLVVLNLSYSSIVSFGTRQSNLQPHGKRQKSCGSCSKDEPQLLGSLKILDLSFSEQLHSIGFWELPALERLIAQKCISLTEVCESVEHCEQLVHVDLSNCLKLTRVPPFIKKKVNTVLF